MATVLLLVIYIAAISLGLPDSVLGSAWPVMWPDLGVGLSAAGLISMIVAGGTMVSSLVSERVIRRFGVGPVTVVSVGATAAALLGYSFAPSYVFLVALAVPLGLGAGAVDAALNNYTAVHYEARHINWMHSFWGVGAFLGPVIMAGFLEGGGGWRGGYRVLSFIQLGVFALLVAALPLWGKNASPLAKAAAQEDAAGGRPVIRRPGVVMALLTFTCYCSVESGTGLWCSSFLVGQRGFSEAGGALGAAMFYGSITVGRFLSGLLTARLSSTRLIRMGAVLILCGAGALLLPLPPVFCYGAVLLLGLGCAPVYPSMIHETPRRFGVENSQKIIGWQMASAYVGSTFFPPLVGLVAGWAGVWVLPVLLLPVAALLLLCSERLRVQTGAA